MEKKGAKYTEVPGSAQEVEGDDDGGHISALEVEDDDSRSSSDDDPSCQQFPQALFAIFGFFGLVVGALSYGGGVNGNALMKQQLLSASFDSSFVTVEFTSRYYFEYNKPYPAVLFSDDQLQVLGAPQFQRSRTASMIAIPFNVIGCFGMLIPILQSNPDNGCYKESSMARNTLILLLFQWIGCAFATASYVILHQSAICGPYYVELTYERQSDPTTNSGYQLGGDAIRHQDVGATCAFGTNFYLSLLLTLVISIAVCFATSNWYHRSSFRR